MDKIESLTLIRTTGLISIMRANCSAQLIAAAEAVHRGGVRAIEVTMTTPDALGVVAAARHKFGDDVLFGIGSVLDPETARSAILAGAGFVVCPTLNRRVIAVCNRYSIPVLPGCFTPTEILYAWDAGADMVKLFPAELGGPNLVKALLAPLPQVQIVPTGGISLDNAAEYIRKGAVAIGVSSNLVSQELLDAGDMEGLTLRAAAFIGEIEKGRAPHVIH